MPLPNHRSVPAGLADHMAPAVAQTFTGWVRLRRPDQVGTRDAVSGRTVFAAAAPYYDGPARVQSRGGGPPASTGSDRTVATGGYLVAVPHTVAVAQPYDIVEVVAGDDPALAGMVLVVDDVGAATVVLQRNLTCSRHRGTTPGS